MIDRLTGKLVEKNVPQIVIDVNGVGYEAEVSVQTHCVLPALGEIVQLFTHLVIREDAHLLFAFANKDERRTFRQLLKVGGIGAKTALGILSALSTDELAQAIIQEDVKRLSSVPGIGKKTAERMILELRGKLASAGSEGLALFDANKSADNREDVVQTLLALGYAEREARAAVKNIASDVEVGDGVRQALKKLSK